jgi:hypothetical protein
MRTARACLLAVVAALVAAAATAAPAAAARAPAIDQLVVFRSGAAKAKRVSTAALRVRVGRRRCAVASRTPLAALVRSRPGRIRLRDYGRCSGRARDAGGLFVSAIGRDRNRSQDGWVYKVGRRSATAGAADPSGPFGRGLLRSRQRVTWFYCRMRGTSCQRTLAVRVSRAQSLIGTVLVVTVIGYDDAGRGVRVAGATVSGVGTGHVTGADGTVTVPVPPGAYRIGAAKAGLVRSFAERVAVP